MLYLSLFVLLLPQVQEATTQELAPPTTAPTYDQGPLRGEVIAMREMRFGATDPEMASRMVSDLRMRLRIRGERITEIVRHGDLILTELVDDTGESLIDDETYSETDKTTTRAVMSPPERLRNDGLILATRSKPSARGARALKRLRGTVRLILAGKTQKLTIENPLQYHGSAITDPRLEELGIEIEIVPADQVERAPPADRCIIFHYKAKGEHVQRASFYDGWMRPLSKRDTWVARTSGEQCHVFYFDRGAFDDEMQLVLDVHPEIEDIQVPIELENVDLP